MQSDPAAISATVPGQKPLILVVDDSRLMRLAIKKILAEDFALLEGVDGEDGWEKLLADPAIQVVFTDLSMPGLDGFGLLERIRGSEDARIRALPVIVITGNEDDEAVKARALSAGATDFITKPFQSVQIRARADAHAKSQHKLQAVTAALDEQTTIDALTQLSNVRYFMQHGNEDLSFAIRHKSELALIVLALDDFAALTAAMDEQARDQILIDVAGVLRAQTRREDTAARLDAARFGLLLPASNSVGTRHLGKRILADIGDLKFSHAGRRLKITASMGIATPDIKADTTFEAMVKSAERRLDVAIQAGGNCLVKDDQTTAAALRAAAQAVEQELATQRQAEQEAAQRAAAAAQALEEQRRVAEETARLRAEAQARAQAEQEARERAEALAREAAEAAARALAEAQARERAAAAAAERARLAAEEQARLEAEAAARQRAALAEAHARALEEEQRAAEVAERQRIEAEARALAEAQAAAAAQAAEAVRLETEAAERLAAEERAQREAAEAIITRAAAQIRLHAEAQETAAAETVVAIPTTAIDDNEADCAVTVSGDAAPVHVAEEMALDSAAPLPRWLAVVLRRILPGLAALNRRYVLGWDMRLDQLRKRI